MSDSFATPWTVAYQAPLSMGFPRQEYWSGLPCPPPGDLPNPGVKPMSPPLAGGFFTRVTRETQLCSCVHLKLCWDFPGGPVVKSLPPSAEDVGSIPDQGTKIPYSPGATKPQN